MFQIAFTFREVLVTGRTAPVCGSGSMKPKIPCLSGRLPVAMEFHSIGESTGRRVARFPMTPWLMKSSSVGINPWSSSGLAIFQSAASQPISRTFLAGVSGMAYVHCYENLRQHSLLQLCQGKNARTMLGSVSAKMWLRGKGLSLIKNFTVKRHGISGITVIYFVPSEGFRPCAPRVSVLREGVQVKVTSWVVTSLLVALIGLSSPSHVWAKPKFKVLASIPGGLWSGLTFDKQGNLYGLTTGGGAYRDGSIFKMTRGLNGKWAVTTLHSFNFNPDGEAPNGDLIFDAKGNLYGTTPDGGAYDGGTVFELAPGPAAGPSPCCTPFARTAAQKGVGQLLG